MTKHWKMIISILVALVAVFTMAYFKAPMFSSSTTTILHTPAQGDKSITDFYKQSRELAKQNSPATTTVTFLATGDMMLGRNVAATIQKNGPTHGPDSLNYPFRKMADILKSTSFNFTNLESPFDPNSKGIIGGHAMVFAAPSNLIADLSDFDFKIVDLANNHALDQGLKGLTFTKKALDATGIAHTGAGNNLEEAWQPAIVNANGIKICFIGASYSSVNDGGKTTNNYVARIEDLEHLKSAIRNSQLSCNFTVVTMHAGTEYTRTPNQDQTTFAHAAIDLGADIVIGGHSHWMQTIERYAPTCPSPINGEGAPSSSDLSAEASAEAEGREGLKCGDPKYIFYSLGNFIFDQSWSQETKEGLTLKITISKKLCHPDRPSAAEGAEGSLNDGQILNLSDSSSSDAVGLGMTNSGVCADDLQGARQNAHLDSAELIPVIIENSQPRPATIDEAKKILDKIGQKTTLIKP